MEAYHQIGTSVETLELLDLLQLDKLSIPDNWHKSNPQIQHISQLTLCGKKTAKGILRPIPLSPKARGTMTSGREKHNVVQDRYILKYPLSVKEFPLEIRVQDSVRNITLIIRGKIDLLDIENSRILDIKTTNPTAMKWIRTGSGKNPPGAKKSHIVQVLVYWYIWNYHIIKNPSHRYWIRECGILYLNQIDYDDLWCRIPLDVYNAEVVFNNLVEEAIGVYQAINLKDWTYLNNKWHYDPDWWLCQSYCDYAEECKNER